MRAAAKRPRLCNLHEARAQGQYARACDHTENEPRARAESSFHSQAMPGDGYRYDQVEASAPRKKVPHRCPTRRCKDLQVRGQAQCANALRLLQHFEVVGHLQHSNASTLATLSAPQDAAGLQTSDAAAMNLQTSRFHGSEALLLLLLLGPAFVHIGLPGARLLRL